MSIAISIQAPRPDVYRRGLSPLPYHLDTEARSLPPAAVLPEQFFGATSARIVSDGVAALMQAILDDALHCWCRQFSMKGRRAQRLAREAEDWVLSDEETWIFSFVNICGALGLDPTYIRRGLARQRQYPPQVVKRPVGHAAPVRQQLKLAA